VSGADFGGPLTLCFTRRPSRFVNRRLRGNLGPIRSGRNSSVADDDDSDSVEESSFDEDDDDPRAQELLSRLCGEVAPNHPGIHCIKLKYLEAPSKYVRMLAETLTSESCTGRTPLSLEVVVSSELDLQTAGAIATILRLNGPVDDLRLRGCGTEACRLICDGTKRNERLLQLEFSLRHCDGQERHDTTGG
jgi:hypothetical protein